MFQSSSLFYIHGGIRFKFPALPMCLFEHVDSYSPNVGALMNLQDGLHAGPSVVTSLLCPQVFVFTHRQMRIIRYMHKYISVFWRNPGSFV